MIWSDVLDFSGWVPCGDRVLEVQLPPHGTQAAERPPPEKSDGEARRVQGALHRAEATGCRRTRTSDGSHTIFGG